MTNRPGLLFLTLTSAMTIACAADPTEVHEEHLETTTQAVEGCSYDGGCTSWSSQGGCTERTCCTVCGAWWACETVPSGGIEDCLASDYPPALPLIQ